MTTLAVHPLSHELAAQTKLNTDERQELAFMAGAEERLGVLENQVARIETDVHELKTNVEGYAEEVRNYRTAELEYHYKVDMALQRIQAFHDIIAEHEGLKISPQPRTSDQNEALGSNVAKVMAMLPGLGRMLDKVGKWVGYVLLLWLLKIFTIDVDFAKLNALADAYQKLNAPGSVAPPAVSR